MTKRTNSPTPRRAPATAIAVCTQLLDGATIEVQLWPAVAFRARDGCPTEVPHWFIDAAVAQRLIAAAAARAIHSANLWLPTLTKISATAADTITLRGEAGGAVRVVGYLRANGTPTRTGVLMLESYGVLAQGRALEILDAEIKESERISFSHG